MPSFPAPLSGLLKSILVACYCTIALSSLLMFLLCINHFIAAHQQQHRAPAGEPAVAKWASSLDVATSVLPASHHFDMANLAAVSLQLMRAKRSIEWPARPAAAATAATTTTAGPGPDMGAAGQLQIGAGAHPTRSTVSSRQQQARFAQTVPAAGQQAQVAQEPAAGKTGAKLAARQGSGSGSQIGRRRPGQTGAPAAGQQPGPAGGARRAPAAAAAAHQPAAPSNRSAEARRAALEPVGAPEVVAPILGPSRAEPAELSFRDSAGGYSANNRGAMPPAAIQSSENQWIPILVQPAGVGARNRQPVAAAALPAPSAPAATALLDYPAQWAPGARLAAGQPAGHEVLGSQARPVRHWRRARLSSAELEWAAPGARLGLGKVYKRVLLCDKTLVSLDYVTRLEPEPRPVGQLDELELNEIGDGWPEPEGGAGGELVARRHAPGGANATSGALAAAATADGRLLERSYLNDDDPLVRCDMWDLEKGLKSRKPPEHVLRQALKADFDTVRDAINRCRQLSERTLPPDDEYRDGLDIMSTEDLISLFSMKRGLIPGTKWCGLGDQAASYNDLGPKRRIDICCRAHDHCPIRSKPFRNDYGVLNIGLYTKSHCDCDADFYRCLREVRSRTADMLGNLYFNVMKLQCMREERVKVCREAKPIALGFERCVRYESSAVKTVFKFTTPPVAY